MPGRLGLQEDDLNQCPQVRLFIDHTVRDDIKSSKKISFLNQFKIGGGGGLASVKFKIANS